MRWQEAAGQGQIGTLEEPSRDTDPTHCIVASIEKPPRRLWEHLAHGSPHRLHPDPVAGSLPTLLVAEETASFDRWLVSTHRKPAPI